MTDTESVAPVRAGQPVTVVGPRVERVMSAQDAERRARAALDGAGLRPDLRELAGRSGLSTWTCHLLDADGATVPGGRGCGKGRTVDARVGALFEALEHYLTGPERFDPPRVRFRSGPELARGPLAGEACAPVLAELPVVACHDYTPLTSGHDPSLPVPVALTTSWYPDRPELRRAVGDTADYRQLSRYGSNSGSAIGVTVEEALVHALNEAIERDALSLLLVRCYLGPGARRFRPRVVAPDSLPAELADAHHTAQEVTGGPVHLVDMTTDVGVPAFLAYTPVGSSGVERIGAGSSLSPHYAAWRALTELLQGRFADSTPGGESTPALEAFAAHPALRACVDFDLTDHLARAEEIDLPVGTEPPGTVEAQVERLVAALAAAGHPPHYRITANLPDGITAVHVLAPGLERFVTILSGMLLLPGPRARAATRRTR